MFGFRSLLQEGHRGGVCYVYMDSATDEGFQNRLTTRSTLSKNVLLDSFIVGPLVTFPKPKLNVMLSLVLLPQNSP